MAELIYYLTLPGENTFFLRVNYNIFQNAYRDSSRSKARKAGVYYYGYGGVIGETDGVDDDVLIYMGVLGGTVPDRIKRYSTVENDVVLGSVVIVLGQITIGKVLK